MKKVPIGVPGEVRYSNHLYFYVHNLQIYVAGPTLAFGYIKRPELNKNRFLEVPREYADEAGTRMYRTGDWGYLLPNSALEICGRCGKIVQSLLAKNVFQTQW